MCSRAVSRSNTCVNVGARPGPRLRWHRRDRWHAQALSGVTARRAARGGAAGRANATLWAGARGWWGASREGARAAVCQGSGGSTAQLGSTGRPLDPGRGQCLRAQGQGKSGGARGTRGRPRWRRRRRRGQRGAGGCAHRAPRPGAQNLEGGCTECAPQRGGPATAVLSSASAGAGDGRALLGDSGASSACAQWRFKTPRCKAGGEGGARSNDARRNACLARQVGSHGAGASEAGRNRGQGG